MHTPTRMITNIITQVTTIMIIGPFNGDEGTGSEGDAVEMKHTMWHYNSQ